MHYALDNKYMIETEGHIKIAVDYFDANLQKFKPSDRVKIAHNISNRIDEMGLEIDRSWISNYSRAMSKTASFSPDFEYNMKLRTELAKVAGAKVPANGSVYSTADICGKFMNDYHSGNISAGQAVDFISEIDKVSNFEYHYDKRIKDPFLTVFGCEANPEYNIEKVAGCGMSKKAMCRAVKKKAAMTKLAETFGQPFATDFAQSPFTMYESMPAPEQQLIAQILQNAMEQEGQYQPNVVGTLTEDMKSEEDDNV